MLDSLHAVETPEGIALSLAPAGLVARFQAYVIDFLLRGLVLAVLAMLLAWWDGLGAAITLIAYFLLEWLYPVFFELGPRAATPGKRVMGLAVVMDSGLPVTLGASVLRNLLRAADFLPFAYAFAAVSMLCRSDFKRLGDLAAGTLVVYEKGLQKPARIPVANAQAPRTALGQRQQAAIVNWAARSPRLTPERSEELAALAASVLPPQPPAGAARSPALLGVAQWLLGRRGGGP